MVCCAGLMSLVIAFLHSTLWRGYARWTYANISMYLVLVAVCECSSQGVLELRHLLPLSCQLLRSCGMLRALQMQIRWRVSCRLQHG